MKFLNGKEQVLDIELTSYGKYLLSKGKFRPNFYAFYDDGILYDVQHSGETEVQTSIQNRIKNETPRLEAQYNYAGVESNLARDLQPIGSEYDAVQAKQNEIPSLDRNQLDGDKFNSLKYPIGTSDLGSQNAPAWNINMLKGGITNSTLFLTGAYENLPIPQIKTKPIRYKIVPGLAGANQDLGDIPYIFPDNSYVDIIVDNGEIIIDVSENNVFYGEQNFDIEVYKVGEEALDPTVTDADKVYKQIMTPLYFTKPKKLIQNNLLIDEDESVVENEYPSRSFLIDTQGDLGEIENLSLDPSYVEYFLTIDVDSEIEPEVLCELSNDKTSGVFSTRTLDCEEIQKKDGFDAEKVFDTDIDDDIVGGCE